MFLPTGFNLHKDSVSLRLWKLTPRTGLRESWYLCFITAPAAPCRQCLQVLSDTFPESSFLKMVQLMPTLSGFWKDPTWKFLHRGEWKTHSDAKVKYEKKNHKTRLYLIANFYFSFNLHWHTFIKGEFLKWENTLTWILMKNKKRIVKGRNHKDGKRTYVWA